MTTEKNKYQTIFDSLPSPAAILNRDHGIDTVNHAWATLFGLSDAPGADGNDRPNAGDSMDWLADELHAFVAGSHTEQVIHKPVHTAMGQRLLSIKIKRMPDVGSEFNGCAILIEDRTQLIETEAALKETTLWLQEMFNALEEAVFIVTPNGRILDANTAARQIFGYTAADLKDQTTELLHVDQGHFEAFTTRVRTSLANDENASFEYVAKRKNGDIFPTMVNISALKKEDGTPLGMVSVLQDISELKTAQEATHNSERFQGALELAGAVCHDMNQPLMAINGYAELLLMDCPEDAPQFDKLSKITEQVAKLGNITQKLMRVTRYETKTYMDQQIIDIDKSSGN